MEFIMTGKTGSIARVAAVAAVSVGMCLVAQRFIALSNAATAAVAVMANQGSVRPAPVRAASMDQLNRLHGISRCIDVIADNLTNAQTVGFKRRRANVGLGRNLGDLAVDMTEGPLESTGGPLDVAITGTGLFRIKIAPEISDGIGYTRCGALAENKDGDLVVSLGSGYELVPPINLPRGATNISISTDGCVKFTSAGGNTVLTAGQMELATFVNPQALGRTVSSIFTETSDSGWPMIGEPGTNGTGILQQGFLEQSNVDPVKEWAAMLQAEQSLQLNSQAMQVLDKIRQAVGAVDHEARIPRMNDE
jgi:flagellar basal-body rod protein FlgG